MAASSSTSNPPDFERRRDDENTAPVDTASTNSSPIIPTPVKDDPALALLAEIAASLKELRAHSDRFVKLLDIEEEIEEKARRYETRQGKMLERDPESGSLHTAKS